MRSKPTPLPRRRRVTSATENRTAQITREKMGVMARRPSKPPSISRNPIFIEVHLLASGKEIQEILKFFNDRVSRFNYLSAVFEKAGKTSILKTETAKNAKKVFIQIDEELNKINFFKMVLEMIKVAQKGGPITNIKIRRISREFQSHRTGIRGGTETGASRAEIFAGSQKRWGSTEAVARSVAEVLMPSEIKKLSQKFKPEQLERAIAAFEKINQDAKKLRLSSQIMGSFLEH